MLSYLLKQIHANVTSGPSNQLMLLSFHTFYQVYWFTHPPANRTQKVFLSIVDSFGFCCFHLQLFTKWLYTLWSTQWSILSSRASLQLFVYIQWLQVDAAYNVMTLQKRKYWRFSYYLRELAPRLGVGTLDPDRRFFFQDSPIGYFSVFQKLLS